MTAKIGLMGGTFDPVHLGHLSIADSFVNSGIIDELWVLLTPFPPHKNEEHHASYSDRLTMLEAAFSNTDKISISTVEDELAKPSYTVQTIRYLKEKFPDTSFYYCMGEDSLSQFHTWKFYQEILDECNLLVANRPNANHERVEEQILSKTVFVDHEPVEVSSTLLKELINEGKSVSNLVPDKVAEIIDKKQLYR